MPKRLTLLRTLAAAAFSAVLLGTSMTAARADGEFCVIPPTVSGRTNPLVHYRWNDLNFQGKQQAKASFRPLQAEAGPQPVNTVGRLDAMVILVEFADTPAQTSNYDMRNYFFGNPQIAPNGSVSQYYSENSYNKLFLTGQIFGNPAASATDHPDPTRQVKWIRMPRSYAYYAGGQNGFGPDPMSARQLVRDAVREVGQLYPMLNWSQFDRNNDGYIDILYIVHAGPGAETSGDPNEIWSHRWSIEDYPAGPGDNGMMIKARDYAMGAEESRVGTHAHEIGHVLGLPDLYTNPQGMSVGVGHWSLMASGSNVPSFEAALDVQGLRPTHFDAWSKIQLGWLSPTLVTRNTPNISLPPVQTNPTVLKVPANSNNPLEYFLIENRARLEGTYDAPRFVSYFDTFNQTPASDVIGGLPGSGVLIYHVDERRGTNDDRGHLLVSVEEANMGEIIPGTNRQRGSNLLLPFFHPDFNYGDPGDPFGNANKRFTDKTLPTAINYNGQDSGARILNITAPPTVSVDLDKNNRPDPPGLRVVRPDNASATLDIRIASIIGAVFTPTSDQAPAINLRLLNANREPVPNASIEKAGTEFDIYDLPNGDYFVEITTNNFIPQLIPVRKGEGPSILRVFLAPQFQPAQFSAGWNMVTFPLDFAGAKMSEVFGIPDLKSFAWNGTEYVADPVVRVSEGYWVLVTDPAKMKVVLPGVAASSELTQAIPVHRGWNLIGNPFPRALVWDPGNIRLQLPNGDRITLDRAMEQEIAANYGWSWRADVKQYDRVSRGDPVLMYQAFWYYSNAEGNIVLFPAPLTPPG